MKISFTPIKYIMAGTLLVGTFGNIAQAGAQPPQNKEFDTFVKTTPTPEGISVDELAKEAPSAKIKVNGENKFAKFVVDLSENVLYTYNNGNAEKGLPYSKREAINPNHSWSKNSITYRNFSIQNSPKTYKKKEKSESIRSKGNYFRHTRHKNRRKKSNRGIYTREQRLNFHWQIRFKRLHAHEQ